MKAKPAGTPALPATVPTKRIELVWAARDAWESIDRPDLVETLEEEFGPVSGE
ncbi:MAG: hypothetical protein AB7H86_12730 [Blastocatellales bacterium]